MKKFLITPHGDWKHCTFCTLFIALPFPHYPSWGLETRPMPPRSAGCSTPHYPSWGLETPGRVVGQHDLPALITPHGDWKRGVPPRLDEAGARLITPHGDWKPETRRTMRSASISSLPLMGIGNRGGAAVEPVRRRALITPHGDWKLSGRTTAASAGRCSLPLMGIGNRAGPSWHAAPRPSHYPSWGLETTPSPRPPAA